MQAKAAVCIQTNNSRDSKKYAKNIFMRRISYDSDYDSVCFPSCISLRIGMLGKASNAGVCGSIRYKSYGSDDTASS